MEQVLIHMCLRLTSSQRSGGHLSWHTFFPFRQRHDWQPSSHSEPACLAHTQRRKKETANTHAGLYSITDV